MHSILVWAIVSAFAVAGKADLLYSDGHYPNDGEKLVSAGTVGYAFGAYRNGEGVGLGVGGYGPDAGLRNYHFGNYRDVLHTAATEGANPRATYERFARGYPETDPAQHQRRHAAFVGDRHYDTLHSSATTSLPASGYGPVVPQVRYSFGTPGAGPYASAGYGPISIPASISRFGSYGVPGSGIQHRQMHPSAQLAAVRYAPGAGYGYYG